MSLRRQSVAAGLWTAGAYFQQDKKRRYLSPAWQGQNSNEAADKPHRVSLLQSKTAAGV